MSRLRAIVASVLLAALPGISIAANAPERDFSKIEVRTQNLGNNVYMLDGIGGNLGGNITVAVAKDGVIISDASYAPLSDKIKAAIAKLTNLPIRYVIDTHVHGDHTGGNENFAKGGAVIVAHDNVRKRMQAAGRPTGALPSMTFVSDITLSLDGQKAELRHPGPAHTDTDSFVFFPEANVLATGDCFTTIGYTNLDVDNGASVDGEILFVGAMIDASNGNTIIVPGHGALRKRADLIEYREMLITARARVAKLIAENKTVEEAVAAKPFADLDAKWARETNNPDRFVTQIYRSLKGG